MKNHPHVFVMAQKDFITKGMINMSNAPTVDSSYFPQSLNQLDALNPNNGVCSGSYLI